MSAAFLNILQEGFALSAELWKRREGGGRCKQTGKKRIVATIIIVGNSENTFDSLSLNFAYRNSPFISSTPPPGILLPSGVCLCC